MSCVYLGELAYASGSGTTRVAVHLKDASASAAN